VVPIRAKPIAKPEPIEYSTIETDYSKVSEVSKAPKLKPAYKLPVKPKSRDLLRKEFKSRKYLHNSGPKAIIL
jgi:hypothetical protein